MVQVPNSEWLCPRTIHLMGGARAVLEYGPEIRLYPPDKQRGPMSLFATTFDSALRVLDRAGQTPIAVVNRHQGSRGKMFIPSDQRVFFNLDGKWDCVCRNQSDQWDWIALAAHSKSDLVLWDIGRRIGHQMEVCEWRLLQVSDAYHQQLVAVISDGRPTETGQRFEDGHTWRAYLAVQSFLVDCCILRDYLAEFAALYVARTLDRSRTRVDSLKGLLTQLKGQKGLDHPLLGELLSAAGEGGWLKVLGAYRDLVVHCVPLARSDSKLAATLSETAVDGSGFLRHVYLPLPVDPASIRTARSANRMQHLEEQLKGLMSASRGDAESIDALGYCHAALGCVAVLSSQLMECSPLPPTMPCIDPKDIISIEENFD